jgi:ABC-type multidrug transport system ATPase subunit
MQQPQGARVLVVTHHREDLVHAITTHGLTRRFPGGHGVFDLDLAVPAGSIYGFLGPNGAGKTTTIRLLLSLLRPDAGEIAIGGVALTPGDPRALGQVGALVESPSLYGHLNGRENLEVTRRLIGAAPARIDQVLRLVDLADAAPRLVRHYSLGMRQRLALGLALLGEPRVLVLDEPTNGLDPAGIHELRALLRRLTRDHGITVFLSSHLLAEIELIATHLGVLDRGRLLFQGTLGELRRRAPLRLLVACNDPLRARDLLAAAGERVSEAVPGGAVGTTPDAAAQVAAADLVVTLGSRPAAAINRLLVENGIEVSRLAPDDASLESLFFALTGGAEAAA